ncbi:siderophore-interacting protein [Corynebacterium sp. TAE3-ERU12]|uniref:siderophore-interacting protein n=1 Tax=Corynebacterium sp. TAE3-ERU12 TaxID=2849491 RepID=UPI001C456D1C|nr:siderophore-interacting protein [Corynebacterium sp. TAE3-ERU12]MBV7294447.1 siderophore-interacting protein [Corynebacterium sp. TAE3-ERU12]
MGRGIEGVVLKLLGADDYTLTVIDCAEITSGYWKVRFDLGGLLNDHPPHPAQWIRMWVPVCNATSAEGNGPLPAAGDVDELRQRGYTIIDTDPATNQGTIAFAIHDGPAPWWARRCQPGDTIHCTAMGSKNELPDDAADVAEWFYFGDTASVPAISDLLQARPPHRDGEPAPARVFLEQQHDDDPDIPLPILPGDTLTWLPRADVEPEQAEIVAAARAAVADPGDGVRRFAWIHCDNKRTRCIAKIVKNDWKLPRKTGFKQQAYWIDRD